MKIKFLSAVLITAFIAVTGYDAYVSQQDANMLDLAITNVEALALGENGELGCGGHSTWVPNHYLGTANCWNGGSHKKCKEMSGVCYNPSEQTDCDGILKKK